MNTAIRHLEIAAVGAAPELGCLLADLYDDRLDALTVKGVIPQPIATRVAMRLQHSELEDGWNRPNLPIPPIDLRLLGVGAAPTATTPQGPTTAAYFEAASATPNKVSALFDDDFDLVVSIEAALQRIAQRPAGVPRNKSQQRFSPFTVRVMPAGVGLMLHHDNHFSLPIYEDLVPQLDASLLLSYFVTLQRPGSGGRLCVYRLGPGDESNLPRLENGMLDPVAFHEAVPHEYFELAAGDMFVFASGRLYHAVQAVKGPLPRVTLGGFFGFDAGRERCLYWS